ncbi:MAG: hypothetical protein IJQ28_01545, partial [Clostridia bacterium]|nr:hypothetical protein [Clostridia bacterium]
IILCTHIKKPIEDKSNTETVTTQESISNHVNEKAPELNHEELFNAYSADDIISFETINSDALIPNSTPEYRTYFDEEYHYIIDYPAMFQERYISGNKAMRIKYANENDSAILSVYACNNLGNISTAELQNRIIEIYGGNVTYSPLKDNWFALSVNDDVFYHYAYFKIENQIIKGFEFHFSGEGNLDTYSKYIDHIYASFKKL